MTGHEAWRLDTQQFHRRLVGEVVSDGVLLTDRLERLARTTVEAASERATAYLIAVGWNPQDMEDVSALFDTSDDVDRVSDWYAVAMAEYVEPVEGVGREALLLHLGLPAIGWDSVQAQVLVKGRPLRELARLSGSDALASAVRVERVRGWLSAHDMDDLRTRLEADMERLAVVDIGVIRALGLERVQPPEVVAQRLTDAARSMLRVLATPLDAGRCLRIVTEW